MSAPRGSTLPEPDRARPRLGCEDHHPAGRPRTGPNHGRAWRSWS